MSDNSTSKKEEKPSRANSSNENSNSKSKKNEGKKSSILNNDTNSTEKSTKQLIDKSKDILVDNFVILTKIGNGAFGQIYLSYDMRGNSEVAVKKELYSDNR